MTGKRAVMLVKKVTNFGEFGYLNSSCIRKSSIFKIFLSSSRDKFTLLQQNSVTDVSVGSGRHVGVHQDGQQHGVSMKISINLGTKFHRISCIRKVAVTRILARVFASLPSFFSRFWTLSIELFWVLFWSILNGVTLKTSNRVIRYPNDVAAVFCDVICISLLFKLRVEDNLLFHDNIIGYLT